MENVASFAKPALVAVVLVLAGSVAVAWPYSESVDGELADAFSMEQVLEEAGLVRESMSWCAPLSLLRCSAELGYVIDKEAVFKEFKTKTDEGVDLGELVSVVKQYFPRSVFGRVAQNDLAGLNGPAIVFIRNGSHCVVYEHRVPDSDLVRIWDPSLLKVVSLNASEFVSQWNGEIIVLDPPMNEWFRTASLALFALPILLVVMLAYSLGSASSVPAAINH